MMVLNVKVAANAKQNRVEEVGKGSFKVYTASKPEKGKANENVFKLLSKHFGVAKNQINIKAGIRSRNKIIEIEN